MIDCDGCQQSYEIAMLTRIHDYGAEVRYCAPCREHYIAWVTAATAKEIELQHALDNWQQTMRQQVPLVLMPQDFPPNHPLVVLDGPTAPPTPLVLG